MKHKSKPKGPKLKPYTYRGVFRCGSCGCFITTETQKGHNYLRCTKRKEACNEPYVREEVITGRITQDEYALKKRSFFNEKMNLQDKVAAFARQSANRFEPEIAFYREAAHVGEVLKRENPEENREIMKKIGSNFRIGRKELSFELKKPWGFLLNF